MMKRMLLFAAVALMLAACQNNGGGGQQGAAFTEEEKEDMANATHPLRQGTTYFHSASMGYSAPYPNSFVDMERDGDRGFTCHSADGVATLRVWGEPCGAELEDIFAQQLGYYNSGGATVTNSDMDDDNSFVIEGDKGKNHFYQRTILYGDHCATMYFEFDTSEREDIDPNAIYVSVGPELAEGLVAGEPPVEATAPAAATGAIAQVAYVGEWHTFSTMRSSEPYKNYTAFKDVNAWEASTDGKEVYLVLPASVDVKVTVKNTVTGERLYNNDGRPLVVRCNKDGQPDVEVTLIDTKGKIVRFVPRHDDNGHPVLPDGLADFTK